MIRKLTACLITILDEAVDDGHLERNPARGRRMRVKVPKPSRTFLEMDELVALTDAAGEQDARFARPKLAVTPVPGSTARRSPSAGRPACGRATSPRARPREGDGHLPPAAHARRGPGYYIGRRAIVATLGGSGVRVSEFCDIRIRDLRLHAASGAHFRIPDAKTEAGVREVQVSPDLLEEIVAHVDRLRRGGLPTDPDAHLFPNLRGGRMTRQRADEIVREAAELASPHLAARGLPALPNTTPHTLRRTYISIALLANRFDVLWVMRQVGHADSKMTMDVYAQLQQRAERQHGEAFDALVRRARERLYGTAVDAARTRRPSSWPRTQIAVDRPCRGCGGLDGVSGGCALPGRRGGTSSRQRGPVRRVVAGRDVYAASARTSPRLLLFVQCASDELLGSRYRFCCSYVKKLMVMAVFLDRVGRLEEVPDAAGEVAFEAADGFAVGLAFGASCGRCSRGFRGGSGRG